MNPKPRFDKRNLWPWRYWMTIGVGVLAAEKTAPDTVILLADTKGSFGASYSMNRLHKLFKYPHLGLYAAAADQIDKAAELIDLIKRVLEDYFKGANYGSFQDALIAASDMYKRARFRYEVLPKYAHIPLSLPEPFNDSHLSPPLLKEWRKFYFGCQMLVGAIDASGQAFLFYLDGCGKVENLSFPGFAAIGSGLDNAMFWLSYRNHHLGLSPKHSAYHAFEAKVMAESSPFVNERLDILIASRYNHWLITDHNPAPKGSPVTLEELRNMFRKYGPRETDRLTPKRRKGIKP